MQSVSQIIDENLGLDDLSELGERLDPPPGWSDRVRTLNAELVLRANGEATVIVDDLSNTYQRVIAW